MTRHALVVAALLAVVPARAADLYTAPPPPAAEAPAPPPVAEVPAPYAVPYYYPPPPVYRCPPWGCRPYGYGYAYRWPHWGWDGRWRR